MQNNKTKIVVDTNVFIRGIILQDSYEDDSNAIDILSNLLENNKIELVFSQDTIGELIYMVKNIVKHKFTNPQKREIYMNQMVILFLEGYSINTSHTVAPRCSDPNDNMFLKCAVQSQAKYIISDDLKSKMQDIDLGSTEVLTSEEFIDEYNKNKENAKGEIAADKTNNKPDNN